MIYLIGGAPRAGKSLLTQRFAAKRSIGWISTDLLLEVLRAKGAAGAKTKWNADPEAVREAAGWFYPCLERFVRGMSAMADDYVIEGVDFLPEQAAQLSSGYSIRGVFLGCTQMTLDTFDRYPGRSPGYAGLPGTLRLQMAQDVRAWSEFVRQEAERFGFGYLDMSGDFPVCLTRAEELLTAA